MTAPAAAPASGPFPAPSRRLRRAPLPRRRPIASPSRPCSNSIPGAATKSSASTARRNPASSKSRDRKILARIGRTFAAQRWRALSVLAVRHARRLGDGGRFGWRGPRVFARPGCNESVGTRGQRRTRCLAPRRRRSGGSLANAPFISAPAAGRGGEPLARDRRTVRASRRQPCASSRSKERKRFRRRLHDGRGRETSRGRRSIGRERARPDADRSRARAAPQPIASVPTRAAAHDAARSGRKPQVPAPTSADRSRVRRRGPAARIERRRQSAPRPLARSDPVRDALDGADRSVWRTVLGAFRRRRVVPARRLDGERGDADAAPRASALAASPAPSGPSVREIDVDLSPGGLEDVSMTMRLAGDKLSVVIRAASSQTLSSIEGARDAIADRMAAIGQPLEFAHCQADGRQR